MPSHSSQHNHTKYDTLCFVCLCVCVCVCVCVCMCVVVVMMLFVLYWMLHVWASSEKQPLSSRNLVMHNAITKIIS